MLKDVLRSETKAKIKRGIESSFRRIYNNHLRDQNFIKLETAYIEVAEDTGYCVSTVRSNLRGYFKKAVDK
jgi:hypothetical protein